MDTRTNALGTRQGLRVSCLHPDIGRGGKRPLACRTGTANWQANRHAMDDRIDLTRETMTVGELRAHTSDTTYGTRYCSVNSVPSSCKYGLTWEQWRYLPTAFLIILSGESTCDYHSTVESTQDSSCYSTQDYHAIIHSGLSLHNPLRIITPSIHNTSRLCRGLGLIYVHTGGRINHLTHRDAG